MEVEIRINNTWKYITNDIIGAITIDRRADEVLDSGAFTFISKDIDYNIPPLTLCKIDDEIWLCSSECNEVIPTNPREYNHNVSLIEATYYLQCYILGTKAMSNTGSMYPTNENKIEAIRLFINNKYELIFGDKANKFYFNYGEINADSRWKEEREYMFGAGTTMFQALLEIGKSCNSIPRISRIDENGESLDFYISWDRLDNPTSISIDSSKIISRQYYQSVDQYTAVLESEVSDVVDRTTVNKVNGLTVRSESYIIEADNQVLLLPTRVEQVTKLEINSTSYSCFIGDVTDYVDYSRIGTNVGKLSKFALEEDCNDPSDFAANTWASFFPEATRAYYNYICEHLKKYHPSMYNAQWYFGGTYNKNTGNTSYFFVWGTQQYEKVVYDISSSILEKSQYDLLNALDKPKYCYYTYNDNVIRGIYEYEQDDFWGHLIGEYTEPMLSYVLNATFKKDAEVIRGDLYYYKGLPYDCNHMQFTLSINPIDYTFNVEYIPISSLYLISKNNKVPFNEDEIKNVSRGIELSSSMSDFDLINQNIDKNNKMLGMPEVSIEYYGEDTNIKPTRSMTIKNQTYYISSVQITKLLDQTRTVINLVSDYSKIAEVYGVKSQFESTRLPLNNIIDRVVYCGEFEEADSRDNGIQLLDYNGLFNLFKTGVLFKDGEDTYLAVEAVDNYCFDYQSNYNSSLTDNIYENKQIQYARDDNEYAIYYIRLGYLDENISLANSKKLPNYGSTYVHLDTGSSQKKVTVYKDARERLIFVCKIKYK